MISKAIYENWKRRNKYLSMVWIDYQQTFDSVRHSWVENSTQLEVNSKIVRFCKLSMEKWNTKLYLKTKQKLLVATHSNMKRNIPGEGGTLSHNSSFV
jgi:hypothetical protein